MRNSRNFASLADLNAVASVASFTWSLPLRKAASVRVSSAE
jgi:hypothetical protein